jgi:hypothetical protein
VKTPVRDYNRYYGIDFRCYSSVARFSGACQELGVQSTEVLKLENGGRGIVLKLASGS